MKQNTKHLPAVLIAAILAALLAACAPVNKLPTKHWYRVTCYQYGVVIYEGEVSADIMTVDRAGHRVLLPDDGCVYVELDE